MKNKIIFRIILVIFVIGMLMILNPSNVDAAFDSSYENNTLVVSTSINDWSTYGGLQLVKKEAASGTMIFVDSNSNGGTISLSYSKTIWLSSDASFDSSEDTELTAYSSVSLNDTLDIDESSISAGSNLYLLEVYSFDVPDGLAINADDFEITLSATDYLTLNMDNSSVVNRAMANYPYDQATDFAPTMCIEGVYDSEDLDPDREFYNYIYFNDGNSKTNTISRGSITMPRFYISFSGQASGNLLPLGTFVGGNNLASAASSGGSLVECSYDAFVEFSGATIQYTGEDTNYIDSNGSHVYTETADDSVTITSSNIDDYYNGSTGAYERSRSLTVRLNKDNPTGIFYSILPFGIAVVIAGVGIVLLKKNSIQ